MLSIALVWSELGSYECKQTPVWYISIMENLKEKSKKSFSEKVFLNIVISVVTFFPTLFVVFWEIAICSYIYVKIEVVICQNTSTGPKSNINNDETSFLSVTVFGY